MLNDTLYSFIIASLVVTSLNVILTYLIVQDDDVDELTVYENKDILNLYILGAMSVIPFLNFVVLFNMIFTLLFLREPDEE